MVPSIPLGPLIIDVEGLKLTSVERQRLTHPLVGGVILFSRNYTHLAQLTELIQDIHHLRHPRLLVTVDHEGGRVQRWTKEFTQIPSMGSLGDLYQQDSNLALRKAYDCGLISAYELTRIGVDLNFAPVLDINYGHSKVLHGARAFHRDPALVTLLASSYIKGLNQAGMQAVGKHYPGHGGVVLDSHFDLPVDGRSLNNLQEDIFPFKQLIAKGLLGGVMTAHIRYPQVDIQIATFSSFWLQTLLRQTLGFQGAIISDDLSMHALNQCGNFPHRVRLALQAGCNLILLCNNPAKVDQVLASLSAWPVTNKLIQTLYAR